VNVDTHAAIRAGLNGEEFIELMIPRSTLLPSTIDGRYLIRTTDGRKPVTGDDVLRLASERASFSWETPTNLSVPLEQIDRKKLAAFVLAIRNSERVKRSVKEMTDTEILEHYALARGKFLTNLGILCVGRQPERNQLGTAPVVQVIKYNEHDQKVNKLVWSMPSGRVSPISARATKSQKGELARRPGPCRGHRTAPHHFSPCHRRHDQGEQCLSAAPA
jgi:ATP-dependent DNA helicase RecG